MIVVTPQILFYIELRCEKCREIKHIECDIDTTKWDIEYIGSPTGGVD